MKKMLLCMIFVLCACVASIAQSADKVSEVLKTQTLTWGQASYFAVTARENASSSVTEESALQILKSEGYAEDSVKAEDAITLEQIAFVCSSTWDIQGSFWLTLKPAARYALRQMKADGIVNAKYDPSKNCSGQEFLIILSKCIDFYQVKKSGGVK